MVRAALVTPLSGPLARYGRATATALRLWARRFTGTETVDLEVVDAHPDASAAVRHAERNEPHLLFGPYGSGPTAEVVKATSRLVWNHGGARIRPRDNVVSVLAPAHTYFIGAVEVIYHADPRVGRVGVLHGDTGFGRGVAGGAEQAAVHRGLDAERAVLPGDPPRADVLLAAGRFDDELVLARALDRDRWRAAGFVAAGVSEVLAELGDRREGLLGPAQWMPEVAPQPDEGPAASEFVAAHRELTGDDPPYPAAQAFAAGVLALRCLHEAGTSEDAAVAAVARKLDRTTLFGRFRLDSAGRQVGHRVLTVQWQDGVRTVVWPPEQAQAALRYPLRRPSG
ncbi:branched-chain amino acid transport system substrate-binding protein [Saccharopolyspora lacisalsi]|uniref:Branched-chain amino acid transport system substrate-binding protein n=1 Tax=Halosaccharopolyspora lacisalsi TaxID=1000566 RepID=A0A839DT83_9PSEU|nr:ABC transporter substrate-binding protein [Halosaccharopolyspora lacisalsi]MBA8823486.1 branched-chain amino acid transport system substrate-binding protein [Halosaccharopolyspora lacisalsi]